MDPHLIDPEAPEAQRTPHNSAPSESSESSESFVKVDVDDLAGISDFGSRVAAGAVESALESHNEHHPIMDERDLYVPKDAADAAAHPAGHEHVDLDEFDPLASAERHGPLEPVPDGQELLFDAGTPNEEPKEEKKEKPKDHEHGDKKDEHDRQPSPPKAPTPEPKKDDHKPSPPPADLKDNAGEDEIVRTHHTPLTDETKKPHQELPGHMKDVLGETRDQREIEDSIREAVQEAHQSVDDLLDSFAANAPHEKAAEVAAQAAAAFDDQNSPSAEKNDELGDLQPPPKDELPASESVSSRMRDLSPELVPHERDGPVTIPLSVAGHAGRQQQQQRDEEPDEGPHPPPRPPTPPKELNEGENPDHLDLGPPPPSHHHVPHRRSEHGLPSILKRADSKAWIDFKHVNPSGCPRSSSHSRAMSKFGILGRAVASLLSLVIRLTYNLATWASLFASIGLTTYTVGEYTMKGLKDQKKDAALPKVVGRRRAEGTAIHSRLRDPPAVPPCWTSSTGETPKKSAIALAVSLLALILFAKFSFVSLLAWSSLLVLGGTVGFRVFKAVEGQVKKTDGSNPFKPYLEPEITVPQEKVHAQADVFVHHAQNLAIQLRRLFLVENLFDSIKFGVLLYTLTYVGSWFSGIALLTLFVLGLFTLPKVYELYQEPIDQYIELARQNVDKVHKIAEEKIPYLKATAAEKIQEKKE
ncbi:Reticulon-like protein [Aphelenchoides fujianensis]|nr:Reticulon-like protein [Aphelenchoides fujianensis]